jgi:hypothetical protein
MIERMVDFNEVDRQLAELGQPPVDIAALLTRHLGPDRSRPMLDQMLAALAQDAGGDDDGYVRDTPVSPPLTSHSTWADWPGKPEAPPPARAGSEPAPASVFPSVSGTAPAPRGSAPMPPVEEEPATQEHEPAMSRAPASAWPNASTRPSSVPAPTSTPAPAPVESLRSLLDRELDPNEFPATPSRPAPAGEPATEAEESAESADDDDFELLIEDEEILEIQEDDVEEVGDGEDN